MSALNFLKCIRNNPNVHTMCSMYHRVDEQRVWPSMVKMSTFYASFFLYINFFMNSEENRRPVVAFLTTFT